MSLTISIGGTDKTADVRWREVSFVESAFRGEVGSGTMTIDDAVGTYIPPGLKAITVDESTASPTRVFTGYIAERSAMRGPMAPGQRQWRVAIEDINARLDDRLLIGDDANRDPETDRARIQWLIGTDAMDGISMGVLKPALDNVNMNKTDYRGKRPRDVLEDCAQKSGANFFLYNHGSGTLLFYDLGANNELSSSVYISDVATDVNNTTVFAPMNPMLEYDPSRVYSRIRVRYKNGTAYAHDGVVGSNFRIREMYKRYMRVKDYDKAVEQAEKWLEQASTESRSLSLSVMVSAANVNVIRAGERVSVKLTRQGFTGYEWWRVTRRSVVQRSDDLYELQLEFRDKIKPTRFRDGPDVSVDEEFSTATDASTPDAPGVTLDADGIVVRGGSISVTNGSGTVIIDGTSDFFSIVASGTLTLPRTSLKGQTYQSISVTTGIAYDPASMFFAKTASKDGKGNWAQPLPEMALSASGTILRMVTGRARHVENTAGTSAKTQVQVMRFTSSPPEDAITVRYYVLQKTAI